MVTTINKLVEDIFPRLIECLKEDKLEKLITEAANYLMELMKERIHEYGLGSDNESIASIVRAETSYLFGEYSQSWGSKRDKIGLQTDFIDLVYTGGLRDALQVGEFDNKISIGFASEEKGKLAEYHEDYRKKDIYLPTQPEIDLLIAFFNEKMPGYLKECLEFETT